MATAAPQATVGPSQQRLTYTTHVHAAAEGPPQPPRPPADTRGSIPLPPPLQGSATQGTDVAAGRGLSDPWAPLLDALRTAQDDINAHLTRWKDALGKEGDVSRVGGGDGGGAGARRGTAGVGDDDDDRDDDDDDDDGHDPSGDE